MTRKLVIVNMSNWDGEDYAVQVPHNEDPVVIRPGERRVHPPAR